MTLDPNLFPAPPVFSDDERKRCRTSGDYSPLMFEWYKFVGGLSVVVTNIKRASPAFNSIPARDFHVLIGLLNRCSRLMLANVALSHEGRFGETTAIIDRCIFESAVKVIWLCSNATADKFVRYLADGLKPEIEFKAVIEGNIESRRGTILPIEERMLKSIHNCVTASGLEIQQIVDTKRLPDLATMLRDINFDRLVYIAAQRLGSHHVHGTWPSLVLHYLEKGDGADSSEFVPRDHDCASHINQYMFVPMMVLSALSAYCRYMIKTSEHNGFEALFEETRTEIRKLYVEAIGGDLTS